MNIESQSDRFRVMMTNATLGYKNKQNIFLMLGDDFAYQQSEDTFNQFELLMDYINQHKHKYGLNILYSTPSKYFIELQKREYEMTQDYKEDDFFPYQDRSE